MVMRPGLQFQTSNGAPEPLGVTLTPEGANFSLFSEHATSVILCLFSPENLEQPVQEISLKVPENKTNNCWHICVHQLPTPFLYAFHLDGPKNPDFKYDIHQLLSDPYARTLKTHSQWGQRNTPYRPLDVVLAEQTFDWEGDTPPNIPREQLIIYEMHVRGFTAHSSSQVVHPGTFLGMIEKIPYLTSLGINAVELLPIFEFNECEYDKKNPFTHRPLYNYWGYSTINFFAPMKRYASSEAMNASIIEFKQLVKALHRAGIEVILDVVYNHTAEGNEKGPVLSFKGIDNPVYYTLDKDHYANYTGCGNTVNCNHPVVQQFIVDSLRYWVSEMHVDGFRFDLASILTRGQHGEPLEKPPLLDAIAKDPVLSKVKLISEPWDAGGLYQLGFFAANNKCWSEWNDQYRDVVKQFIRGVGPKGIFMTRLCGSQDIYGKQSPACSINFITAHDGFTLKDLVSYNHKHNWENGEENRDGFNSNESWNCGAEGATQNKKIQALRTRQMRNFMMALMISRGIPLMLMGDEYGHTRRGNNNAWCQDNELNWFLWDHLQQNEEFHRFCSMLIRFRKEHPIFWTDRFYSDKDLEWHGQETLKPNWSDEERLLAWVLKDPEKGNDLYVAFNSGHEKIKIKFPDCPEGSSWHWIINTASPSPYDFRDEAMRIPIVNQEYGMQPYSALLLKQSTL